MQLRTTAILRGHPEFEAVRLAQRCWEVGIDMVEVSVQGEMGWQSLEAVASACEGRPFGAGTVLSNSDVLRAVAVGASLVIGPGLNTAVIDAARAADVACVPGVFSPTEVAKAQELGISVCKLFPAGIVGPRMVQALHGPFPSMAFLAVGGIHAENAIEFIEAGAAGVAFGSSITDVLDLTDPAGFVRLLHETIGRWSSTEFRGLIQFP